MLSKVTVGSICTPLSMGSARQRLVPRKDLVQLVDHALQVLVEAVALARAEHHHPEHGHLLLGLLVALLHAVDNRNGGNQDLSHVHRPAKSRFAEANARSRSRHGMLHTWSCTISAVPHHHRHPRLLHHPGDPPPGSSPGWHPAKCCRAAPPQTPCAWPAAAPTPAPSSPPSP